MSTRTLSRTLLHASLLLPLLISACSKKAPSGDCAERWNEDVKCVPAEEAVDDDADAQVEATKAPQGDVALLATLFETNTQLCAYLAENDPEQEDDVEGAARRCAFMFTSMHLSAIESAVSEDELSAECLSLAVQTLQCGVERALKGKYQNEDIDGQFIHCFDELHKESPCTFNLND